MVLPAVAAAAPRAKPARTGVTINTWPKGLFGYVKSPKSGSCAARRWVLVYRQRGRRQLPAKDKRIARVQALGSAATRTYQWSIRTAGQGRFYVRVAFKRGCATAASRSLALRPVGRRGGEGDSALYPACSPWISDSGGSVICHFAEMHFEVDCSAFTASKLDCATTADSGPFPWGLNASAAKAEGRLYWDWGDHKVLYVAYTPRQGTTGTAHLGGTMPGPGSDRFTIEDGFAQNESGYPNGDHFYTPDIPGQAAGEVGGPLRFRFVGGGTRGRSDAYVDGYLYLKR